MDKLALKRKLLEKCFEEQDRLINATRLVMDEAMQSAEDEQTQDWYDSIRNQLLSKRDMFAKQLQKAFDEKATLERLEGNKKNSKVSFGSVVVTENQRLFVSISLGKIELNNETYFAISPQVPLFKVMEGLKKGDSFMFNGKKHQIKDLF
jgi:hypothetical protein